jgi:dTDP-4-dehydrorhamnose 3,5-epimerase
MTDTPLPLEFDKKLQKTETPIPGLLVFDLAVFGDNRGWFKENWQREKMLAIGLPDFGPVQNNFSFNGRKGTMRGIHAEPWDKFISVGSGSFFGAWVDIREDSPTFGTVFTAEIDSSKAIFVPAGVANSYLTLEDNTVYSYLVNDHWHPEASYSFINATDPELNIKWPIPQSEWEMSEKDKGHPMRVQTANWERLCKKNFRMPNLFRIAILISQAKTSANSVAGVTTQPLSMRRHIRLSTRPKPKRDVAMPGG